MAGTRWWRRDDAGAGTDVWGGPDEVTVAPGPRTDPEDADDAGDTARRDRERAAQEHAEREQAERAERERSERSERERAGQAERERAEQAERERAEQAERERAEQAERERAEQAERERAEQAERERAEQTEREERERAEQAERERVDRLQREREEQQREDRERRERQRAEQERRVAARQEQARREREERERREQEERAGSDDTTLIPLAHEPVVDDQDRVSTLPGAETVPPALARDAAAREAAAREAAAADRKRRRRRVLSVFLVALLAVAAVWILPRLVALALSLVTALGGAVAPDPVPASTPVVAAAAPAPDAPRPELPRGGTTIAPGQRVVVMRVDPVATPEETADRLDATATPFTTTDRGVLPALELPVHDAVADAGAAWQRLAVTRAHRQVLLLAVATGPTGVGEAIDPWERLLREPDVGLALDAPGPLPPEEIARTSDRLAGLVRDAGLPQKLLVVPAIAAGPAVPAEVALVAVPGDAVSAPVLRGVVLPPGGPAPREVLAAAPSPDVVLLR
ncbi:hypothetical protein ACQPX6_10550 [Actinomycetospora sp. CA-101289]|uniref:hypothetical protein n=1 Tax=Actinomycetospora sp. CA-101289 TaxID=3239893 RepID=UPI003D9891A0